MIDAGGERSHPLKSKGWRLTGYAVAALRLFADKMHLQFNAVRFAPSCSLEHPDTHSCRECSSELFAAFQIVWADDLRS